MGVFNYWNQAYRLPKKMLKDIQSLAYNYIWGERRDFSWKVMTLPKGEGGLGLRDFRKLAIAASMRRVWRLWVCEDWVWTEWMRLRYIKGNALMDIVKRPNVDSTLWTGILDDRDLFCDYLKCGTNYDFLWAGHENEFSFKNAWETIRRRTEEDVLVVGIWSSRILKHATTLWRARWNRITTLLEIANRLWSQ